MNRKKRKLKFIRAKNHLREWNVSHDSVITSSSFNGTAWEFAFSGYRFQKLT